VDVVAVAGPMAFLDVVTDCFEQVGLVQVANLHDVRGILDGDGIGLDVNDAALSVVPVSRELVHRVVCCVLCVQRELLSLPLDSYPTASAPRCNALMQIS